MGKFLEIRNFQKKTRKIYEQYIKKINELVKQNNLFLVITKPPSNWTAELGYDKQIKIYDKKKISFFTRPVIHFMPEWYFSSNGSVSTVDVPYCPHIDEKYELLADQISELLMSIERDIYQLMDDENIRMDVKL